MTEQIKKTRLRSLDAFRGLTIAAMIVVNSPGDWEHVFPPLRHSEWNGCTPTDLVFPCFIFMMGLSIVFAFSSKRTDPKLHGGIIMKAFRRMLIIVGIGLALQLIHRFDFSQLRFPGVLQRIGVVYFIATCLYIKLPAKSLYAIAATILVLYYGVVCLFPPAGLSAVTPTENASAWFDHLVLSPGHLAKFAYTDPCGILGTFPAVVTAMIGIFVGLTLKNDNLSVERKTVNLLIGGNVLILAGLIFSLVFPFNKPLWSSSYVLYAGGICTVGFAIFYWIIDVKGKFSKSWLLSVLGINAITAYVLSESLPGLLLNRVKISDQGKGARGMKIFDQFVFSKVFTPEWSSLLTAILLLLLIWGLMYILYKKQWIIKI